MYGKVLNPIALRKAKIVYNFGLSECNRVKLWDKKKKELFSIWDKWKLTFLCVPILKHSMVLNSDVLTLNFIMDVGCVDSKLW